VRQRAVSCPEPQPTNRRQHTIDETNTATTHPPRELASPQDAGDQFDGSLWDVLYRGYATAVIQNIVKPDAMVRF
jgi:hypothetical protein